MSDTDRRRFIKQVLVVGTSIAAVPTLGMSKTAPDKHPGVLFVDAEAVDIEDLCKCSGLPEGMWIVAVYPRDGMSVRDSLCTSHDIEDINALELERKST